MLFSFLTIFFLIKIEKCLGGISTVETPNPNPNPEGKPPDPPYGTLT